MFRYPTKIRAEHVDHYGHMNNAAYMQIFEEARWALLETLGFTKATVEERHYGPILVEAHLYYKRELELGAQVWVETDLFDGHRRLFRIHQWLKDSNGELSAEADLKLGLFDMRSRKLMSPPPDWLKAMSGFR